MTKSQAKHYGFCEAKCIHWKARRCKAPNKALQVRDDECVIVEEQRRTWQMEMMGRE